jgi:hypothetical protein
MKLNDSIINASLLVRNGHETIISASRIIYESDKITDCSFAYFRQLVSKYIKSLSENPADAIEKKKGKTNKSKPKGKAKSKKAEPKPFVLSAWDFEGEGRMMDFKEYCEKYNLDFGSVMSYKLITHTGTPYFNTLFKETHTVNSIVSTECLENIISKWAKSVPVYQPVAKCFNHEWFDRLIYSDTHIGMDTDKDRVAMYSSPWNKEIQLERARIMVDEMLKNHKGTTLYVDELGDFMDGWDGFTTRGGHSLPQNMSNEEAFSVGIDFKMTLIDGLINHYDKIYFHNICNDNHAGAFGYIVNDAVKRICYAKYGEDKIQITNQRQFINYYVVGKHAFVNTHGKDSKSLKFGFKPKLDPVQIEKIDAFLKYNGVYKKADYIEFAKGDSHQMLLDYCTSDDFDYFNYPAFSPASEWVQTNFKKSRSGFVIQQVMYEENVKHVIPSWFKVSSPL